MAMPDLYQALARQRKADAIADAIWTAAVAWDESEADLTGILDDVIDCPEHWRARFAEAAGQRPPSPETWALVADRLREHVALCQTTRALFEAAHRRTAHA